MTARKVFYFDGKGDNVVTACGSLFFKEVNSDIYLLLIKYENPKWPHYDDFGGKVDEQDDNISSTIMRETSEETNGIISKDMMKNFPPTLMEYSKKGNIFPNRLGAISSKLFYTKQSKYCLQLIEVTNSFFQDTSVFGDREITDDIKRTINWYKYENVKNNLAMRLRNNELIACFDLLKLIGQQNKVEDPIDNIINDKPQKSFPRFLKCTNNDTNDVITSDKNYNKNFENKSIIREDVNKNSTADDKIYLKVSFTEKEEVKRLGGRWDPNVKKWYCKSDNLSLFTEWR